ncbi:MAG: hypothetical protein INH41_21905 [Myxococcaceae bacterium]|jgi:hypothetical protein|nr:hypothetical protein [Myxococcaceae bacterium]MCA3015051.1 hypothetical protein [Myxococcaceae bacterium]
MERKGGSTAVVTTETVARALTKTTTTPVEEKALRMRYGAPVDLDAPLPKAHGDNEELADELLLLEMRLLSALKRQRAMTQGGSKPAPVAKSRNGTKAKVVAALKSRKKR